jgi:predicted nucleotidyltransferase
LTFPEEVAYILLGRFSEKELSMGIKERWKGSRPLPEYSDIKDRLNTVEAIFERNGVVLAYLFGSLVRSRRANDIDLAVLMPGRSLGNIRHEVWDALGTERVDIVNLASTSTAMKFEIIRTGRLIYKMNSDVENRFEAAVLREYKDRAYPRRRQGEVLRERMRSWSLGRMSSRKG